MLGGAVGEVGAFAEVAVVDVGPESLGESGGQRCCATIEHVFDTSRVDGLTVAGIPIDDDCFDPAWLDDAAWLDGDRAAGDGPNPGR